MVGTKDKILKYFSFFVLAIIMFIAIIFRNQFTLSPTLRVICLFFMLCGMIIWISGILTLGKYFTVSIIPKGLVTGGIYSKIRHPIYYGVSLIFLGLTGALESLAGLWIVMLVLIPILIYSAREESKLLEQVHRDDYYKYLKAFGVRIKK